MGYPAVSQYFKQDNGAYYDLDLVAVYGPTGNYPIYSNLLDAFAVKLKQHVRADNQAVIGIFGRTGSGKSTLAVNLCKALNKNWKLSENLLYGPNDLKRKLRDPHPDPINLFDEGSVIFNSLETTTTPARQMAVLFDTMRSRHMYSLIVMPDSADLNKRIARHLDFKLECPNKAPIPGYSARGFFNLSYPIRYLSGAVYWQKMGTGLFNKMGTRLNNEYQALKRAKQDEILADFIKEDD